ncbi:hypothetical protein GCM10027299_42200 [Larkinella ripae]
MEPYRPAFVVLSHWQFFSILALLHLILLFVAMLFFEVRAYIESKKKTALQNEATITNSHN